MTMAAVSIGPEATRTEAALSLMLDFLDRTGLTSALPATRYLWTDAFAVCNLFALARATGESRCRALAIELIDQVHHTLGKHRSDDSRRGWISGFGEEEGEAHPTRGGLRIGKPLPERRAGEPLDEPREWDRDGQYFHYLTQWMHALDQAAWMTGQARYNLWARELAETAYRAFGAASGDGGPRRLRWKMSIDLTRPLVASMGQHDALDGFICCLQLRATAALLGTAGEGPDLKAEWAGFAAMLVPGGWTTTDPLGLGGLLADAGRLSQLLARERHASERLLRSLLAAIGEGLRHYDRQRRLWPPASERLPFRELGLAIGLQALPRIEALAPADLADQIRALRAHESLGAVIEAFWQDAGNQQASTWRDHRDINAVMLATCLIPEGYLRLGG